MKILNRFNIGKRLYFIFGVILLLTLVNLVYNIINLGASKESVIEINSSLLSIDYLIEADRDAYQSSIAISNALQKENFQDDKKLADLIKDIEENKIQVKERYTNFSNLFNVKQNEETKANDATFWKNYNQLTLVTDQIVSFLKQKNASTASSLYLNNYNTSFKPMRESLNNFTDLHLKESNESYKENLDLNDSIKRNSIIIFFIIFALFVVSGLLLTKSITGPLKNLKDIVSDLSLGKLPDVKTEGNDEIAQMGTNLTKLTDGLKKTASFAVEIGKGNLQTAFNPLSDEDVLGHSLIQMKTNLAKFAKEDDQRSWSSNGVANLSDILRNTNLDAETLYLNTLTFIVKYMKANQGGLFIINNEKGNDTYIELVAAYAYEKKKFLEKRINIGEGLVGQVVIEKEIIYLTDVPDKYVKITSGLGEACPKNILLVPLKNNEEVFGVIELASFEIFEEYEIEFLKKIAEGIASTISSVKVNEKTQRLLETSQQMTEELRAQEEEMRQNMEELHATQEETTRREQSLLAEINELKSGLKMNEKND